MASKRKNEIASGKGHGQGADTAIPQMPAAREPVAEGAGQSLNADAAMKPLPAPPRFSDDPRIQQIAALARERHYWLQMRLRNTARLAAEVRYCLQPTRGQDEEWDGSVKTEALKIVSDAVAMQTSVLKNRRNEEAGKKPRPIKAAPDAHPLTMAGFVVKTALALADWQLEEARILGDMEQIAGTLDIAPFVDAPERKGFTLAGLAVIIGHSGHPLDYPKKGHLWKRLGLAPYQKDGITRAGSTWGRVGGLGKDDWIALGYKRSRLGDLFGKITQPLLYAQWRSTGAIGPYGEAYGRYKARQIELNEAGAFAAEAERQVAAALKAKRKPVKALTEGKLPPSAINARALRYMTKKLIADLWFAWRRLELGSGDDKSMADVSTAASRVERKAKRRLPAEGQEQCAGRSIPSEQGLGTFAPRCAKEEVPTSDAIAAE